MFGNNRKKQLRNKVITAAVGVAVMTLGIWLNYNDNDDEAAKAAEEAVQKVEIDEEIKNEEAESIKEDKEVKSTDTEDASKTYLVKEESGVVNVYLCEGSDKALYLITSIPYDLLSENDQQMFKDGVILDTDENLGKFLENFDS